MNEQVHTFTIFELILICIFVAFALLLYMLNQPKGRGPNRLTLSKSSSASNPSVTKTKVLNVIFQYNGHDFDAFEVLGLPAGSSFEVVKKSYNEQIKWASEDKLQILKLAYQAIEKSLD